MLYGRDVECRLIDDLLDNARRGRSGALVLRGDAGIGKTALLQYAVGHAGNGRVLDVRGVEVESALPFAGLHALLYPVRDHLPSLSRQQREALDTALGLAAGEAPSRFLVAAAVLELLAAVAEERPTYCIVDDAHWVDPQSLASLTFAQRRLRGDRIAMIFALRTALPTQLGQADRMLATLPHVAVGPLDNTAVEQLLDERPQLDLAARTAVKVAAHGNPLALVELSAESHPDLPARPPSPTRRAPPGGLPASLGRTRQPGPPPASHGFRRRHG
jgi:predicted ATPase